MKTLFLAILGWLLVASQTQAAEGAKGFQTVNLALYQPNDVVQARVVSADDLGNYIKRLQAVCVDQFATNQTPETLHVVVALRPGKRSRIWFISSTRGKVDATLTRLGTKLGMIPPCEVRNGPVAFAISGQIAGGDGKFVKPDKGAMPPIPKEWKDAAKGRRSVVVPDGFLDLVWPERK